MSVKALVEAALYVAKSDLTAEKIAQAIEYADVKDIRKAADELVAEYEKRQGGIEVFKTQKSYGMRIRPGLEEKVSSLIEETDMPKAMLKTLAIIAYEQPIRQSYIVKIRGNRSYEYIRRLEESGFIKRKSEGHTKLISTAAKFNKYFRIDDSKRLIAKKDIQKRLM